jgi:hypothetical protein
MLVMPFMPESPVYLVSRGKDEAAHKALKWLRSADHDVDKEVEQVRLITRCDEVAT